MTTPSSAYICTYYAFVSSLLWRFLIMRLHNRSDRQRPLTMITLRQSPMADSKNLNADVTQLTSCFDKPLTCRASQMLVFTFSKASSISKKSVNTTFFSNIVFSVYSPFLYLKWLFIIFSNVFISNEVGFLDLHNLFLLDFEMKITFGILHKLGT